MSRVAASIKPRNGSAASAFANVVFLASIIASCAVRLSRVCSKVCSVSNSRDSSLSASSCFFLPSASNAVWSASKSASRCLISAILSASPAISCTPFAARTFCTSLQASINSSLRFFTASANVLTNLLHFSVPNILLRMASFFPSSSSKNCSNFPCGSMTTWVNCSRSNPIISAAFSFIVLWPKFADNGISFPFSSISPASQVNENADFLTPYRRVNRYVCPCSKNVKEIRVSTSLGACVQRHSSILPLLLSPHSPYNAITMASNMAVFPLPVSPFIRYIPLSASFSKSITSVPG